MPFSPFICNGHVARSVLVLRVLHRRLGTAGYRAAQPQAPSCFAAVVSAALVALGVPGAIPVLPAVIGEPALVPAGRTRLRALDREVGD